MSNIEQLKQPALFIIDGSPYLYRGFFGFKARLSTSAGLPTRAIYNVTAMLMKVLREKSPQYCVMVWDAKAKTFRHELYPDYKANRPPMPEELIVQLPKIKDIVSALGIPQFEIEGVEADDVIASIIHSVTGIQKVIVSGDKDLIQLLDDQSVIWDPVKDKLITSDDIVKEYSIPPERFIDVQTLSGDSSDNISGVKGIGPKKAVGLIQRFGSVDELYRRIDELPKGKMRENLIIEKDNISLYRELVTLKKDVKIPLSMDDCKLRGWDIQKLCNIFEELEFKSLLREVRRISHNAHKESERAGEGGAGDKGGAYAGVEDITYDKYQLITGAFELNRLCDEIRSAKRLVIDTETDGIEPISASIVGISISVTPPVAYYIPIGHRGTGDTERNIPIEAVKDALFSVLSDPEIKKTGHNIKFDLIVLRHHGLELQGIAFDTMIASYLLDPARRQHNLASISRDIIGHEMISYKELVSSKGLKGFSEVSIKDAIAYSCEDVHITGILRDELYKRLKGAGLLGLFSEVEMPLVSILARMEENGVMVDIERAHSLNIEFEKRLKDIEEDIFTLVGARFNIKSPKQLQEILFERLGLTPKKKTKKTRALSTDLEVLNELKDAHPVCPLILSHRNLSKLKGTYIEAILKTASPVTHRVHTSFNQTVTATGRLSSSNPNLQNIPVRTEDGLRIRELFIAPEGRLLLSFDYSQIDLRVLAHYSEDDRLIASFMNNEDIHKKTASLIFGCPEGLVTEDMRRMAKTVNFGIVYGMSYFGLSKELGIKRREAKEFIEKYFKTYPKVKEYMKNIVDFAQRKGYVLTLLNRRRFIPEINSSSKYRREFAERTAINTPIQGTAADIIKLAMIKIDRFLSENNLKARMILQVHDEIIIEAPEEEIDAHDIREGIKGIMEGVISLKVPLIVNTGIGRNWREAKA